MKIWHILRKSLPKLWERITAIPLVPVLPEAWLRLSLLPGATLTPGIELILNAVGLEQELSDADVVVTGEGRLDFQTAMGKAPVGVAKLAKKHGCTVIAFAGALQEALQSAMRSESTQRLHSERAVSWKRRWIGTLRCKI